MNTPRTADEFHQRTVQSLDSASFFEQGQNFLAEYTAEVVGNVIPRLAELEGRWHPLGFAVFPLTVLEDGSPVRLHVWPEAMRKWHSLKRRAIHDHAWHIISRVLTQKAYRDARYYVPRKLLH